MGGRLFETCANLFKLVFGWALIWDVRLFETCVYSRRALIRAITVQSKPSWPGRSLLKDKAKNARLRQQSFEQLNVGILNDWQNLIGMRCCVVEIKSGMSVTRSKQLSRIWRCQINQLAKLQRKMLKHLGKMLSRLLKYNVSVLVEMLDQLTSAVVIW